MGHEQLLLAAVFMLRQHRTVFVTVENEKYLLTKKKTGGM